MVASDMVVTLKLDSEFGKMLTELADETRRQRREIAAMREVLCAVAARVQALETLPGVAEALAATADE